MFEQSQFILNNMLLNYPQLKMCYAAIEKAVGLMKQCYSNGGKILTCGNGGSSADSEHIVGELLKGFLKKRKLTKDEINCLKATCHDEWEYLSENLQRALPAISLVSQSALFTAYVNDMASDMVFAQQVFAYGKKDDILLALSTSGNSRNVVNALKIAKAFGVKTIGLTGENGGQMKELCDVIIMVPSNETYRVQEYHLPVYHTLCAIIESEFFEE